MLEDSCVVNQTKSDNNINLNSQKMATPQNVIFRLSIVLGMVAAVVTIIYLSPLPDHSFLSCDRPCHALDWPMICRMKVYIENPDEKTNCENCTYNFTNYCKREMCSLSEDPKHRKILINGQMTGPSIQVCQNDILVVDVINKIPGQSLTVHWRGQPQNEAPFMDGVPLVTQCPILSYTTFQYKFRASSAGTHYYHAYSDQDRSQGLFGALIVRQPDHINPHRKLYEIDSKEHIILLSEWSNDKSILINGKGPTPSVFNVAQGNRYRFRLAYTAGELGCPITLSIDNHLVKIISVDGNPIKPHEVSSISLNKGERVDFVLKSNQAPKEYSLRAKSECGYEGLAVINYEGSKGKEENTTTSLKSLDKKTISRDFDTVHCESSLGKVCLGHIKALKKLPEGLKREIVDKVLYLTIGSRLVTDDSPKRTSHRVYVVNNLTFLYPSSPLLTQLSEVAISTVCDEENIPEKCTREGESGQVCECVHVEYIPLGSGTEIILINQDNEEHVFHLHGHSFWVIASKQFKGPPVASQIKTLDEERKLLKRNLNNPVVKDTIRIQKNSVIVLRFIADNAGFWMLRDENSKGWTRGMDIVFQIGDTIDMVSMPTNFPTCGNFIGPDFFLT